MKYSLCCSNGLHNSPPMARQGIEHVGNMYYCGADIQVHKGQQDD